MALSNMKKEPQREITESLVGILGLIGALWLDYWGSQWFQVLSGGKDGCPWPLGMLILPVVLVIIGFLSVGIAFGTHALGEVVCGALAKRGLELRPRVRK